MRHIGFGRFGLGAVFAFALTTVAVTGAGAQTQPSLAGVWRIDKPLSALRTSDGKAPPLTPSAAKQYSDHLAARSQNDTSFDSATWCAAVGMPRIMLLNSPFQIMVRPQYVAFLHEWNWWARIVYLEGALSDKPAPPPGPPPGLGGPPGGGPPGGPPGGAPPPMAAPIDTPAPMGLSRGRWEGDTLVVETAHLDNSKLLDSSGLPYSGELKVTERLRLTGPDSLEDRIRFEDPATFTQPWEAVVSFRRQHNAVIKEDVCLDRIKTGEPAVKE